MTNPTDKQSQNWEVDEQPGQNPMLLDHGKRILKSEDELRQLTHEVFGADYGGNAGLVKKVAALEERVVALEKGFWARQSKKFTITVTILAIGVALSIIEFIHKFFFSNPPS